MQYITKITAFLFGMLLFFGGDLYASPIEANIKTINTEKHAIFPYTIFSFSEEEKSKMDINPNTYKNFWENWHLVTVKWRQDTREIRYAYANDLAWKTLLAQKTEYPVGAMFGKLVYPTEEDLALPSSVMPANIINRVVMMLWDPKHEKVGSDGWVYQRFINPDPRIAQPSDGSGTIGIMTKKEINACVNCHARAHDRGYVFSQPTFLFGNHKTYGRLGEKASLHFEDMMTEIPKKSMPRIGLDLIDKIPEWKNRNLYGYIGDFFSGALGEMRPVMIKLAEKNPNNIYMIYDRDDPNVLQLASHINYKNLKNCVALMRLRGSGLDKISRNLEKQFTKSKQEIIKSKHTKTNDYGVTTISLKDASKPNAQLFIYCNGDAEIMQVLPLLYASQAADGLPQYHFAPIDIQQ